MRVSGTPKWRGGRAKVRLSSLLLAALGALALAPAASANALDTTLSVPQAVERDCIEQPLAGAGVASENLTSPVFGAVSARLSGGLGDWDLAIFDAAGTLVAASADFGPSELARGFVDEGEELVLQACRRSGESDRASLHVVFEEIDVDAIETARLLRVDVPNDAAMAELQSLGLDLTEHGGPGFVELVAHGLGDLETLDDAGFTYTVEVEDLGAQSVRQFDQRFEPRTRAAGGGMPSGRTSYRRLADYQQEMKDLVADRPKLIKRFRLPFKTFEGRRVHGIVISRNVRSKRAKQRPIFLNMGLHHAREWPSGEHAIEWAYELLRGYDAGNKRYRRMLARTRMMIVPVVNPDGFNTSVEAGLALGRGGPEEVANIIAAPPGEYRRKNCRSAPDSEEPLCPVSFGIASTGVDPNRNYGGFWGGPGASTDPTAEDYRGPGPFSEPETKNIRWLLSRNQVTTLITNHTFSNLVLRPPGLQSQGPPPDEKLYRALGRAMADENGYTNQRGYQLYDTSGTTEDWSYYTTGGLGYTFEIGPHNFHPPYADVVAEWHGTTEAAGEGRGNRVAYLKIARAAGQRRTHSILTGKAPRGAKLTIRKRVMTPTSRVLDENGEAGERIRFRDKLRSTITVARSGRFRWHVNPSTRPLLRRGVNQPKARPGKPSPAQQFSGTPGPSAVPCGDAEAELEACFNDHPVVVPGGDGIDNGTMSVRVEWATIATDWDMQIFRDTNGDGSSEGEPQSAVVGASQSGPTDSEATTVTRPALRAGKYVVRMTNFAATEPYDGTVTFGKTPKASRVRREPWKLICSYGGETHRREVFVARGGIRELDLRSFCR